MFAYRKIVTLGCCMIVLAVSASALAVEWQVINPPDQETLGPNATIGTNGMAALESGTCRVRLRKDGGIRVDHLDVDIDENAWASVFLPSEDGGSWLISNNWVCEVYDGTVAQAANGYKIVGP